MKSENLVALVVLAVLVWWLRRPVPAIATVATSSQWWDEASGTWREL